MSDELHVVSLVTLLDAVHTDGVAVCRIAGVTPVGMQIVCLRNSCECPALVRVQFRRLPVKIMHWVAGVA